MHDFFFKGKDIWQDKKTMSSPLHVLVLLSMSHRVAEFIFFPSRPFTTFTGVAIPFPLSWFPKFASVPGHCWWTDCLIGIIILTGMTQEGALSFLYNGLEPDKE